MKSLIALLVLVSGLASAAEIKVYETALDPWSKVIKGDFEVNPALDRAWVSVEIADRVSGRDIQRRHAEVKVPGLSYDSASAKIMLDIDGQQVECGFRTGRSIFRRTVNTGCAFERRTEKRLVDDGYRTYMKEYLQLFLVTR